jgi:uncharacterized protein YjbJ (UPF0337 family)
MNSMTIKGHWNTIKGRLKQRWARLTDNNLRRLEGEQDELLGRVQKRVGVSRPTVEQALERAAMEDAWASRGSNK